MEKSYPLVVIAHKMCLSKRIHKDSPNSTSHTLPEMFLSLHSTVEGEDYMNFYYVCCYMTSTLHVA